MTRLSKTQFGPRVGLAKDKIPAADAIGDLADFDASFDRYRISLPTLSFPKETAKDATVSGDITFITHDDGVIGNNNVDADAVDPDDDNIRIWIIGSTTGGADDTVTGDSFLLIDNDQMSRTVTLTYGGAKIAQDADPTDVTVTATLDGAVLTDNLRFTVLLDEDASGGQERHAMRITERTGAY